MPARRLSHVVVGTLATAALGAYTANTASAHTAAHARAATLCSAKSYGATGDGTTKDTAALQAAINACAAGGTAELTPGRYLSGALKLPSGITLRIDSGATLLASQNASDYPAQGSRLSPLLGADSTSNVTITGSGTIDGQGAPWWALIRQELAAGKPLSPRPQLITLQSVNTAKINGITLKNAPNGHVTMTSTTGVTIDDITIASPADAPNTDGIDVFSSTHVAVTNSSISDGDDNMAIDSGTATGPSHDISLSGCAIGTGHGLSIGSYTSGGVYTVNIHDDTLNGTTSGIRLKSNRGRGGDVHTVTYANLTMTGVRTPILVTEYYPTIPADGDPAQPITSTTPHFHDITITNVTATGATTAGQIIGVPEQPVTGLSLNHVTVTAGTGLTLRNAHITATSTTIKPGSGSAYIRQSNSSVN